MPPSDSLTEWVATDVSEQVVEQVSVRRLPAETAFLFRPVSMGTGIIHFAKKVVGAVGGLSMSDRMDVEVMVTAGKTKPAAQESGRSQGRNSKLAPATPAIKDVAPGQPAFLADPLVMDMLSGHLGFPAQNPVPSGAGDTQAAQRRKYPLPFAFSYVLPQGSYLLNPTHRLPLPDTPPGLDTSPPAYQQALALAKRGLLKEASEVLDDLLKEQKNKKQRNPLVESSYEFVNAHLKLSAKEYEEAIKKFKSLFSDKDYGVASRFYAALATEYSGDTLAAITGYQGVISYNPEGYFTPEAAYRIARIFLNARANERAMKEYLRFMEIYPRSPFIDDTIMDLAHIYDQIYDFQNFDLALKLYDGLIKEYGESPYLDSAVARRKFILENYF